MSQDISIMSLSCNQLELFVDKDAYIFYEFSETKKISYLDFLKIERYNMDKKEKGMYYIVDNSAREEADNWFFTRKYNE